MKKNLLILLVFLAGGFTNAGIMELTPQQVQKELSSGQALILDVNPEGIYKKYHVPKSKNVGFNKLSDALPKDKSKKLIFYCMNEMCTASHQAAQTAVKYGYKNVARMPSGIGGWLKAGLPTEGL